MHLNSLVEHIIDVAGESPMGAILTNFPLRGLQIVTCA
jgi:hypothetical protein